MSHFLVLVAGNNVDEQLAPYHEYECTGVDDEYVVDVDITDEVLESFKKHGGEGESLEEFAIGEYGSDTKVVGGKVYNHTNPNAKWDWYSVGGRWTGFLRLKDGAGENSLGEPGFMTPGPQSGFADVATKGDVDFDGMADDAEKKAASNYDEVNRYISGVEKPIFWDECREKYPDNIDKARDFYHGQEGVKAFNDLNKSCGYKFGLMEGCEKYFGSREEFLREAREAAIRPFAIVFDGEWYEKGRMGWFGAVGDEKSDWGTEARSILNSIPEHMKLTVVDCHI